MKHAILFSSGIASALAAERVLKTAKATLLFTDTLFEDEDNYRFINDVKAYFDSCGYEYEFEHITEGRNPLQLFTDEGVLGCDRIPVCSRKLKTEQTGEWLKKQTDTIILYFGFDAQEFHRAERVSKRYQEQYGIECRFPLCEPPYAPLDKFEFVRETWGIEPPRMYALGFKHANCGGRCVRGKLQHWRQLLRVWPERFKQMEDYEARFKGGKYTFLKGYSLRQLRKDYEQQLDLFIEADSAEQAPCIQCVGI